MAANGPVAPEFSVVGKPRAKADAMARITGEARFTDDLSLPGMLTGRLLRGTHAHARIRSVDTSRAAALPGVLAVLTGPDLPIPYGILPVSQDEHALATDRVRYVGEPVAAVAALDEETAERALRLITVDYEPLPPVRSIEDALNPDGPLIHGEGKGQNLHKVVALEFGDVDEGFAVADHIREDVFGYGGSTHAPLEQPATLAALGGDGRLTVWSATQVPHYLHRALARVLEMPTARIRVVVPPVGGGFGGKTDILPHEIVAASLALVTGRPVKITLTREEVFHSHRGRHPARMWVRTGFRADGRITAMHFRCFLDGGAYGSYGVASIYYTGALQTSTYQIPHYRFEGVRVFTNKPPCGPKRGHGTPQPRFAIERHLDAAAADLGLDPVGIRTANLVKPFTKTVNHLRITTCGLEECMRRVVAESGYERKHGRLPRGQGVGFAVGSYLSGAGLPIYWNEMPQSEVHITVDRGGGVTVFSGATDIGQGSTAALASIVAETLGISPDDLAMVTADTDLTPVDLGSYSSRVTFMAGNAALEAAQRLVRLIAAGAAARIGADAGDLVLRDGRVSVRDDPARSLSWPEAVRVATARCGALTASGTYRPPDLAGPYRGSGVGISPAYSYSAAVAQVTADPETGEIAIEDVWLAHDIGRSINPALVAGQVEGGVVMAVGEALMEEHSFRPQGTHRGPSLLDYKIPGILDSPRVHTLLIETVDPEGPFGAKEVGQGPLLPVVPAIAAAVEDALGVAVREVPATPDRILKALRWASRGSAPLMAPRSMPSFEFPAPERVAPPERVARPGGSAL